MTRNANCAATYIILQQGVVLFPWQCANRCKDSLAVHSKMYTDHTRIVCSALKFAAILHQVIQRIQIRNQLEIGLNITIDHILG